MTGRELHGMEVLRFGIANHLIYTHKLEELYFNLRKMIFKNTDETVFETLLSHLSERSKFSGAVYEEF